jgi:hypothetical protein
MNTKKYNFPMTSKQALFTAKALEEYLSFCKTQIEKDTCEYTKKNIYKKLRSIKVNEKREAKKENEDLLHDCHPLPLWQNS